MDYAIIEIGGTQRRVSPGDTIRVNRLDPDRAGGGTTVHLDRVLMVRKGDALKVGSPHVAGALVEATVLGATQGKKVLIFKKKKRKQYRRTRGHRQQYTSLRIDTIQSGE